MDNLNQQFPPAPQPPASIINPPPEQPSPPNRSWLKWVVLVVLVALLSSAGTYFVLTQTKKQPTPTPAIVQTPSPTLTPDETANWKTYADTYGKYSIKYPNDYSLEETASIKSPAKFPAGEKEIAIKPSDIKLNFIIYIQYYLVPDISQADKAMEQVRACDKMNEQETNGAPKGRDFIIDNQKAIMYEDSLCAQFTATNFYILRNDRVYSISVASTEQYSLHKAIVDKILSTFKFLD